MNSGVVVDASALLAFLNSEPGGEKLTHDLLSCAIISTVNLAEVHSKLVSAGIDTDRAWEAATIPVSHVAAFDSTQAKIAGDLVLQTRALGLSLGDRACLALAKALDVPAYTADKSWKQLKLGVRIHLIR